MSYTCCTTWSPLICHTPHLLHLTLKAPVIWYTWLMSQLTFVTLIAPHSGNTPTPLESYVLHLLHIIWFIPDIVHIPDVTPHIFYTWHLTHNVIFHTCSTSHVSHHLLHLLWFAPHICHTSHSFACRKMIGCLFTPFQILNSIQSLYYKLGLFISKVSRFSPSTPPSQEKSITKDLDCLRQKKQKPIRCHRKLTSSMASTKVHGYCASWTCQLWHLDDFIFCGVGVTGYVTENIKYVVISEKKNSRTRTNSNAIFIGWLYQYRGQHGSWTFSIHTFTNVSAGIGGCLGRCNSFKSHPCN